MTRHFRERVAERIGPHIDADLLAEGLRWAIKNDRRDLVRFRGRVSRRGLRVFEFRVPPEGRHFFALVDTNTGDPVTVMPEGFRVPREGKRPLDLERLS